MSFLYNERPIDSFVKRSMETLQKEYLVIGKTRVSSLTSVVVLAFFLGMTLTIGFLASRTGTFEESEEARRPRTLKPIYSSWSKALEGSCEGKISATTQCRSAKVREPVMQEGRRKTITAQGYQVRSCIKNCGVTTPPVSEIVKFCSSNTNDPKKLDVVFVPLQFGDQNGFALLVLEHIDFDAKYKGLLYFEPFKSSGQKFKFWKTGSLPANIESSFIQKKCRYADSSEVFTCATEIKNWLQSIGCSYDKALVVVNNSIDEAGGGWAESLGGKIASTIAREYPPFENQGHMETVHEFAHLLGLADEAVGSNPYNTYNYTIETIPNSDVAGCPKWCGDYVRNPSGSHYELCKNLSEQSCRENVNCGWLGVPDSYYKTQCVPVNDHVNIGLACVENTGCYHNSNGIGAWRPADYAEPGHRPTSMMFYMMNALGFDGVDRRYLKSLLGVYE